MTSWVDAVNEGGTRMICACNMWHCFLNRQACHVVSVWSHGFALCVNEIWSGQEKKGCSENDKCAGNGIYRAHCGRRNMCDLPRCVGAPGWRATLYMAGISATSGFPPSHLSKQSTCNGMLRCQPGSEPFGIAAGPYGAIVAFYQCWPPRAGLCQADLQCMQWHA